MLCSCLRSSGQLPSQYDQSIGRQRSYSHSQVSSQAFLTLAVQVKLSSPVITLIRVVILVGPSPVEISMRAQFQLKSTLTRHWVSTVSSPCFSPATCCQKNTTSSGAKPQRCCRAAISGGVTVRRRDGSGGALAMDLFGWASYIASRNGIEAQKMTGKCRF